MSDRSPVDKDHLVNITNELMRAITSPEVIEQMRQFREKARAGANFEEAGDLMSLESLRAAGANLPDGFRITSREFEDKETGQRLKIDPAFSDLSVVRGISDVSGCAGGGAATVCGCAGGGN
jgi:hypothetical protein